MPMSTITVAGINPGLNVLGNTQQLNYTQSLSAFQLTNSFVPIISVPSQFNQEFRNNVFSGFRLTHLTTNTDTYGSLTLQNFVNAQTLGNDMMKFDSTGINIFVPFNMNSQAITNATWNGTPITVQYGGTGLASTTAFSVICGGTTTTGALQSVASLGTAGQVLTSQGASSLPIWSATGTGTVTSITAGTGLSGGTIMTSGTISLTTPVSLANGGTNASLTALNGGLFYSTTTSAAILSAPLTANQILLSGAGAAPSWSTVTYPSTTTINQLLYSSANNVLSELTTANNGVLITSAGGAPSIGTTLPSTVQGNITSVGTIASGIWNGSPITVQYGGTGLASTNAFSVICGGTTTTGALQSVASLGTARQVLTSQGAAALPIWGTKAFCSIIMSGNVLTTTVTSAGTPYRVSGSTTSALSNLFTATQNKMTLNAGTPTINVAVNVSLNYSHTGSGGGPAQDSFAIFKNAVAISSNVAPAIAVPGNNNIVTITLNAIVPMSANDFIEIWVTSTVSGIVITVANMNFIAVEV